MCSPSRVTRSKLGLEAACGAVGLVHEMGDTYHELQRDLKDADLARVRDAKIVILEENESFVARTGYVNELRKIVTTP